MYLVTDCIKSFNDVCGFFLIMILRINKFCVFSIFQFKLELTPKC